MAGRLPRYCLPLMKRHSLKRLFTKVIVVVGLLACSADAAFAQPGSTDNPLNQPGIIGTIGLLLLVVVFVAFIAIIRLGELFSNSTCLCPIHRNEILTKQ